MRRFWTEEEKDFLKDNAKEMFLWQVASILDRTAPAVHSMCQRIGVRFPPFSPPVLIGELNGRWKGDECGYYGQHHKAIKDFPPPLGTCQVCLVASATDRARIDHTNLPYRKEYVVLMCHSCNQLHSANHFVFLFQRGPF